MPPKIDQFVPLVPTMPSAESREFQITLIPHGEQVQPLENGVPTAGSPSVPKKHGGPTLSVQRDNGRITHIKIQCNCGQLIDVECIYKDGKVEALPKAAATPKIAEPPKAATAPKVAEPAKPKAAPKAAKAAEAPKGKASKGRK